MSAVDYDWVRGQMTEAKVRVQEGNAVLALLKAWETVDGLSTEQQEEALELFTKLALSHALIPEYEGEIWVDAERGFLNVGDTVRIKHDAFPDAAGLIHNGRRGRVVGIRQGDIYIRSTDDKEPFIDGSGYPLLKLQKRIK